jgi:hypothetical protein
MFVHIYSMFAFFSVQVAALRQADPRPRNPTDCVWIKKLKKRPRSTRTGVPLLNYLRIIPRRGHTVA